MAAGWKDALMADTGAPWNIPYVEPADLVRDYPAADEAQALAIAAGLTTRKFGQIVQTVKTDTFTTTSTSFVDVTGLTVTITPSSLTSKVLLIVDLSGQGNSGSYLFTALSRSTTNIYEGDAAGSRSQVSKALFDTDATTPAYAAMVFLDSPNVASATTYAVRVRVSTGTGYVNRTPTDTDNAAFARAASSITAIEVAA
jgi:hypothetical protein